MVEDRRALGLVVGLPSFSFSAVPRTLMLFICEAAVLCWLRGVPLRAWLAALVGRLGGFGVLPTPCAGLELVRGRAEAGEEGGSGIAVVYFHLSVVTEPSSLRPLL